MTGVTGAVGTALLRELANSDHEVIATARNTPAALPGKARFLALDVRRDANRVIAAERPEVVIHLAAVVSAMARDQAHMVDVGGMRNVLAACLAHGVQRLIVTSSGAAYGYHADNPVPLKETDPLRGNPEFAYADHKRQIEAMLAEARKTAPELEQVILRVSTVLGDGMNNQITALFHKPRLLAIAGSASPFVFISSRDLARILVRAIANGPPGIYNVAGDGAPGIRDLATSLGKPVLALPAGLLKAALAIARPLGLSAYGPEQVRFLQYRPVLDNTALKQVFGYTPEFSSMETFINWQKASGL